MPIEGLSSLHVAKWQRPAKMRTRGCTQISVKSVYKNLRSGALYSTGRVGERSVHARGGELLLSPPRPE